MKIALIKLGSRVAIGGRGTSGGTGEALSVIKILTTGGHNVTVFTKILPKDITPTEFSILNIEDTYESINSMGFDALLILNGSVNFFGGQEDRPQLLNYHLINNFKGKVFYILCDPALVLTQVLPSVSKKEWSSSYLPEDLNIIRKDIIYVSQARLTSKVLMKAEKHCKIAKVIHFPFEKFPLLTLPSTYIDIALCTHDISYGGTFRSGRREESMVKFFFGLPEDIKVEMFGKIELDKFKKAGSLRAPDFNGSVSYDEYSERMKAGISTVVIGDPLYKDLDNLAQRIYESIQIGNVVFIDDSYDFKRRVFKNKELQDFCYITSRKDLALKVKKLKENPQYVNHIVALQKEDTKIDIKEYCDSLTLILEDTK